MVDPKPHPHIEMLRAIYSDLTRLAEFASDDIVLHAAGPRGIATAGPRDTITGDHIGKQAVLARSIELYRRSGGSLVMTADHIVANDYFGAVLGRLVANRNGQQFEAEFCGLWRFEDGLIVEHWENVADWPAAKRFFLDQFDGEANDGPVGLLRSTE